MIERSAKQGDARAHALPRPMLASTQTPRDADYYDFSFSGLKTAVATRVRELSEAGRLAAETPNLAASFQQAVVETLVAKTMRAVEQKGCRRVLIGGGVAASGALRRALTEALGERGELYNPSHRLATDNGAMIARAGLFRHERGEHADLRLGARPDLPFPGMTRRA